MNLRTPLICLVLTGCQASANLETSDADGADTSQSATTQTTQSPSSATVPTGTTDPTATADTGTETPTDGSESASQSGSQTGEPTAGTGTSGSETTTTSDTTDTSDTTGDSTSTGSCTPAVDGPAPVVLGDDDDLAAPGAYAILAKTAITNVPGSVVVGGHVGISPATHTGITGFALVVDPSGEFATSPVVMAPGKVYAADYMIPTPVNLTTAVLAMQVAYTDAAGRIPADELDLEDGDIGGLTLAPGIYNWGSSVLVPEDVTLAGCEDDVWIFQIAGDLDVSSTRSVVLAGGARASNVFWQVAGAVTVHADAHLEGVLLGKTAIVFQTGASLTGRAYAQTMVVLDKNAVTAP